MFLKVSIKLFCYVDNGKKFEKVRYMRYVGIWEIKTVRNALDMNDLCVLLKD